MKKILVTGVNSYVGNRFTEWVEQYPDDYEVDRVSVRDGKWKEVDLSIYDTILHVAGIAHRKETKGNSELYYKVNRDLAFNIAEKAKASGIQQFIFLSTMSVYGLETGVINQHTPLDPKSNYGKSKKQAEEMIQNIADDKFKVAVIRPPMIYGEGCKGNYQRLRKVALKTPVFPEVDNMRSMIYVDNLSKFFRYLIDYCKDGIYCPQNKEYVRTTDIVKEIALQNNRKIRFTRVFNPLLNLVKISVFNKVFGDLIYNIKSENDREIYCKSFIDFTDTVKLTED